MTLEIWRRNTRHYWPWEPEIVISAPSAIIVIMAINSFMCYSTSRYVWKVREF